MSIKNKMLVSGLFAIAAAVAVSGAEADSRGAAGYQTDSSGDILRDGAGDCLHDRSWTRADATVIGCDGVVLNAPIEVFMGKGTGNYAGVSFTAGSMFAFDSAELSESGKAEIDNYRMSLGPDVSEAKLVLVVGHTDSSGDDSYNQALSLKRAQSVADYLIASGTPQDVVHAIGRGSKEPLVSNDTKEGRAENRRVDIYVIVDLRALDSILFPSAALFERRSGSLSPQGIATLDKNRMAARDLLSRATFIEIVGHTDDVGDDDYNMALSLERAQSVRDYLVSKGLDPNKILVAGMGETDPIASNSTPEGRAENRRVEVLVLGRLKQ
jgi:OOP family OmpA-OmpF porin